MVAWWHWCHGVIDVMVWCVVRCCVLSCCRYVDTQSGYLCADGEPPTNIAIKASTNITVIRCTFNHLGAVYVACAVQCAVCSVQCVACGVRRAACDLYDTPLASNTQCGPAIRRRQASLSPTHAHAHAHAHAADTTDTAAGRGWCW